MTENITRLVERYLKTSQEDREIIDAVMSDVLDVLNNADGGGVLFIDSTGEGNMSVHILGDTALAPLMLQAAPMLYEKVFGVPDGVQAQ